MRKTTYYIEKKDYGSGDIHAAMQLTGVGRWTTEEIAKKAEASFKIGRRKLYNLGKMQQYLDSISE